MKALIQRVSSASVTGMNNIVMFMSIITSDIVEGKIVGSIEKGLCVLLGIHRYDTDEDIDYMYH